MSDFISFNYIRSDFFDFRLFPGACELIDVTESKPFLILEDQSSINRTDSAVCYDVMKFRFGSPFQSVPAFIPRLVFEV